MLKTQRLLRIAAVLALCPPLVSTGAQSQAYRFQEAIHLMETKGDYPAAIELFEEIALGSDRTLAARALLNVGFCYEKLGRAEAVKAYQAAKLAMPPRSRPSSPRISQTSWPSWRRHVDGWSASSRDRQVAALRWSTGLVTRLRSRWKPGQRTGRIRVGRLRSTSLRAETSLSFGRRERAC